VVVGVPPPPAGGVEVGKAGAALPPPPSTWAAHCVAVLGERGAAALGRA